MRIGTWLRLAYAVPAGALLLLSGAAGMASTTIVAETASAAAPAGAAQAVERLAHGTVVALQATPHLWIADEQGQLHWSGDTRALSGRTVDWSSRREVNLDGLKALPRAQPWLSAGLLQDGEAIDLLKWETDQPAPRRLHIQSIADLELFGIDQTNYGQFVLAKTAWEVRYGMRADQLERTALPRAVLPATPVPAAAPPGQARFADDFTARNGTPLNVHNAAWIVDAGQWEIQGNRARMRSGATSGAAMIETSGLDHEISATITLPAATAPYPQDWFAGLFARYRDNDSHLRARYLYQNNSPEVELWQIDEGRATLLDYVNLGPDGLLPGSTHRMRVVVQGANVSVYHDGRLTASGRTTLTRNTRVAIGVSDNLPFGQPAWDDVQVGRIS
jgi:hypothetical protein